MPITRAARRPLTLFVALACTTTLFLVPGLFSAEGGPGHGDVRSGWWRAPEVRGALGPADESCADAGCHASIESATLNMGFEIRCTFCHGGDGDVGIKELSHVQPTEPVINDKTTLPLDYDPDYLKFVNPSNLRAYQFTCGACHIYAENVVKSMMATAAGHYAGGLYLGGAVPTKTPVYGTFATQDNDGWIPTEDGAVPTLLDLVEFDPADDPSLYSTHFKAVPGQACARCHLWSRGKGYRGAENVDGTYRADGCAACHMPYADDGRSQSADTSIDHVQQGHPKSHTITRAIPTEQCLHCHHRGARIGLSFTGRAQMPPRLLSGPGVTGTTDQRFNSNYHLTDTESNPPDLHGERGLDCIDCHTAAGVMGDGNIYGHMDQATKTECGMCHGSPDAGGTLVDHDGEALTNVVQDGGLVRLTTKVSGEEHVVPQIMASLDPFSPSYNPEASCAMNDNHLAAEGGLECYSCHAAWIPNCFGCHFERDEREMGQNLITREWEAGKVSTNNKIFESLKSFSMGRNSEGRVSPYIVGCQVVADVTAPDGSKILDFVMPTTANGLSGLGLQPVHPHTVRGPGELRTCAECHRAPPALGLGSGNYAIARNHLLVAAAGGVQLFDRKSDPTDPSPAGTIPRTGAVALSTLPDVIEGTADYLYVAAGPAGVEIYDMQGGVPASPVAQIAGVDAIDVVKSARYLYVVDAGVGVRIYDNLDPAVASLVATVPIPTALRVAPWGIHLAVAAGSQGLLLVDVTDHAAPTVVRSVGGIDARDVTLYAHMQRGPAFAARAYVADPGFGVRLVDLLPDIESASLIGGFPLPGALGLDTYTRYLAADATTPSREHDYLYVAAGTFGLRVLDITEPDAPFSVASLPSLGGYAVDVDVSSDMNPPGVDDYAMVANVALGGVHVVDVTDPRTPVLLTTLAAPGASRAFVEVQQLDRYIDEEGNELKENSHPNAGSFDRDDIVAMLSAPVEACAVGGCCQPDGSCMEASNYDCAGTLSGSFGGEASTCADSDVDGVGDACDCAPADDRAWLLPGPALELRLTHAGAAPGTTTLAWTPPAIGGAPLVRYDLIVSASASELVLAAGCVESDDTDTQAAHAIDPPPGSGLYFVVRPGNLCGGGSAGTDSAGAARTVRFCP